MTDDEVKMLQDHCTGLMTANPNEVAFTIVHMKGESWCMLLAQTDRRSITLQMQKTCTIIPVNNQTRGKEVWCGRKLNAFIKAADETMRMKLNPSLRKLYHDCPDFPTVTNTI